MLELNSKFTNKNRVSIYQQQQVNNKPISHMNCENYKCQHGSEHTGAHHICVAFSNFLLINIIHSLYTRAYSEHFCISIYLFIAKSRLSQVVMTEGSPYPLVSVQTHALLPPNSALLHIFFYQPISLLVSSAFCSLHITSAHSCSYS